MQRTKLKNKFLKDPSGANKFSYNKQKNWCVSLLRKEKKKFFFQSKRKDITDNKNFWQTIKTKSREKTTLIENENLVSDDAEVANYLNIFFLILLKTLKYLSMK